MEGMARFFIPGELWVSGEFPEAEARHASQVLRLGVGDRVEIFDGTGRAAQAELAVVGRGGVRAVILEEWKQERLRPEIHLMVALIKNERFDWLVQKATELGAASIRPVSAARSVVRVATAHVERRREKWMQVAIGAAKQCGHLVLPEIFPVTASDKAFSDAPSGLKGIPAVGVGGVVLRDFLEGAPGNVTFAVGPEGDWTPEELERAYAAGFVSLHLGHHVLRSETAALHVLSVAAHHFLGGVGGRGEGV